MTLAQRIVITSDGPTYDGRAAMAVALAALMLFAAIAVLVFVGVHPAPAQASAQQAAASPIANADQPACTAALARARDTRGLPVEEAIAASTAMLRACDVH